MKRRSLAALLGLAGLVVGCSDDGTGPGEDCEPSATVVCMANTTFVPATLTVTAGTSVTWRNGDGLTHNTTSNPANPAGPAGSAAIAADGSMAAFIPARRAMSWQMTDPAGTGVVRERYWVTFQPGELRVCASCHGPKGQPPESMAAQLRVRDLTSAEFRQRASVELIANQVRQGSANKLMPAFAGTLSEAQIAAVAAHVMALSTRE